MRPSFVRKISAACASLAFFGAVNANIAQAKNLPPSTNIYGALGLNTIPSARMDETGTVRAGISTLDPYAHSWISAQLAKPFSVVLRQSAETASLTDDADHLYPGIDFKLHIMNESKTRPAIAIGATGATGHKRMAGEYIAASKRYKNFDFTAGLGWGRFAAAGHFKNPLKSLHNHFGKDRLLDGEMPNTPNNWFTGEDIGLFAGLEYFTPIEGLSIKADYGADRYSVESASFNFNAPAPWSLGLNYKPADWVDLALAAQGTDKIMARLSFQGNIKKWRKQGAQKLGTEPFRPYRTGLALPAEMRLSAQKDSLNLYGLQISGDGYEASAHLSLKPGHSTPRQLGLAATHIANHAGQTIEKISITPGVMGLKGPQVQLMRRDLEKAKAKNNGSAEEIWHNAEFKAHKGFNALPDHGHETRNNFTARNLSFKLDNQFSLAEEDSGTLYRTSLIGGWHSHQTEGKPIFFGLLDVGTSFRINIKDNLEKVAKIRPRIILPVRSNEDRFAARTFGLETAYNSFTHSFRSDLHLSLIGGYLEEMYGGAGGEILYRPHNARWALGAESWLALKRAPETTLNLGFNGDHLLTGHLKGWYDVPKLDVTLHAKIGRYLAQDIGGSLSVQKTFENGASLEGFLTVTDQADYDLFGGTTHAYNGIRLSLPLGGFKYAPQNSAIDITAAPFGRDTGQALRKPFELYDLTESFSTRHLSRHWEDIAE